MCDGMGGLSNGEYASAVVVNAFTSWFMNELPRALANNVVDLYSITERWKQIVIDQGEKILQYGQDTGCSLGTTITALLIINDKFVNIHVGDSRLYRVSDSMHQLTKDQTVAQFEIEHNRMTVEQAENDRRSSILLQCVGASKVIEPFVQVGTVAPNEAYMLCSDGFRHLISNDEMYSFLAPQILTDENVMKNNLVSLVELNKSRGERDNITALLIKTID